MQRGKFVEGNLFRHVFVMATTSSIGLMAVFAVDLITMIYISWLGDPTLTAAVGYGAAVLFFTTSFGIGMSIGISALVSQALGRGDPALARRRASEGIVISFGLGLVFLALLSLTLPHVVVLMGAQGRVAEETLHFLRLVVPGQIFMIMTMVGANILRAYGDARRSMMVTVWGALILALLDPLFILWLDMGLTGAALSGWGSRIGMMVMALWPVYRKIGGFARVTWAGMMVTARPMWKISGPAVLTQLAMPIGQILVTRMVGAYGEEAVAGMAIVGRLTPVAFAMIFSMASALGPIIGQNMGAGQYGRVKSAIWDAIIFSGIVITLMSLVLFLARDLLAGLFHAEGIVRELLFLFCGPLSLLFFFNALIFVGNAACNNLGAAFTSTLVNWGRNTLGTVPFAWVGIDIWGVKGVLIGQALGGVVFGLLAAYIALFVANKRRVQNEQKSAHRGI